MDVSLIGFILLGAVVGLLVVGFYQLIRAYRKDTSEIRELFDPTKQAHETKDIVYCEDCGLRYVPWKRQNGFEPSTGEPKFEMYMACPGFDPQVDEQRRNQWYASIGFYSSYQSNYTCGKRVFTEVKPDIHTHVEGAEVDYSCPGCIEMMVGNGVISRERGDELQRFLWQ